MAIRSLQEKFVRGLNEAYDAEHQFLEAQRQLMQMTTNDQVQALLRRHTDETEQQIRDLEQLFSTMGERPNRVTCLAAQGLVSDGQRTLEEITEPRLRDLKVADAQFKAEYSEIAAYRALVTAAEQTGMTDAARVLRRILQQEEQTAQMIEQMMPQLIQRAETIGGAR